MNALEKISALSNGVNEMAKKFQFLGNDFIKTKEDFLQISAATNELYKSYLANKELDLKNKFLDIQLTKIANEFQLKQKVLEKIFDERNDILQVHYKVIDEGIRTGNVDLMLQGLKNMTDFAVDCPIEKFKAFSRILDDPNETLYLDF